MRRQREIWPWFLLVPYFAVLSLNIAPWIGERRHDANRTNAQLTLALLFASIALPLLSVVGITGGPIGRAHPFLLGVALIVPPMAAISLWLNRTKEAAYQEDFRSMALPLRAAFGLSTVTVASVCLWLFFTS
jgi:hypothetical protein